MEQSLLALKMVLAQLMEKAERQMETLPSRDLGRNLLTHSGLAEVYLEVQRALSSFE